MATVTSVVHPQKDELVLHIEAHGETFKVAVNYASRVQICIHPEIDSVAPLFKIMDVMAYATEKLERILIGLFPDQIRLSDFEELEAIA